MMKRNSMDLVAANLTDALTGVCKVSDLADAMRKFIETYPISHAGCMKMPAFRKLWEAMDEAARYEKGETALV